jgi:hypothetical protein
MNAEEMDFAERAEQRRQAEAEDERVAFETAQEQEQQERARSAEIQGEGAPSRQAGGEGDGLAAVVAEPQHPPTGAPPTAREDLTELAKIAAVEQVLKERKDVIRARLQARTEQIGTEDGVAPTLRVKGLGMMYRTDPAERAVITNDIEWTAWCAQNYPERTSTREAVNVAMLKQIAAKDLVFTKWLVDQGVFTEEVILEDGLTGELAQTLARSASGGLVDPATGEVLPVVMQKGRQPQFTVKIDPAAKERFVEQVRASLDLSLIGAAPTTERTE